MQIIFRQQVKAGRSVLWRCDIGKDLAMSEADCQLSSFWSDSVAKSIMQTTKVLINQKWKGLFDTFDLCWIQC